MGDDRFFPVSHPLHQFPVNLTGFLVQKAVIIPLLQIFLSNRLLLIFRLYLVLDLFSSFLQLLPGALYLLPGCLRQRPFAGTPPERSRRQQRRPSSCFSKLHTFYPCLSTIFPIVSEFYSSYRAFSWLSRLYVLFRHQKTEKLPAAARRTRMPHAQGVFRTPDSKYYFPFSASYAATVPSSVASLNKYVCPSRVSTIRNTSFCGFRQRYPFPCPSIL